MGTHRGVCRVAGGWTLIELIVVMAMVGILAAVALPSFGKMLLRRHLEGVAAQVHADLQYLRTEAVARNAVVQIAFHDTAAGTCYVIHTGADDACSCDAPEPPRCQAGALALRSASFAANSPVQVRANVDALRVDPRHGTVSPAGRVLVVAADGSELDHVVSVLGRISTCSPGAGVPGVVVCK